MLYNLFFNDPTKVAEANTYFQAAVTALKPYHHTPTHAAVVLLKMMEAYRDKGLGFYKSWHHVDDAKQCIAHLKSQDDSGLQRAIDYIGNIPKMEPTGDFALLLNTFFAIYPHHITSKSPVITNILSSQDMWASCIDKFHDQNTNPKLAILFNLLPRFDELLPYIPRNKLDAYATTLIEMHDKRYTDISTGWIVCALGMLYDNLSPTNKKLIQDRLSKHLADSLRYSSVVIIGLAEALCNSKQSAMLSTASQALFRYFTHDTADILSQVKEKNRNEMRNDIHNDKYFKKIIPIMLKLISYYNYAQHETIFFHLMKSDNLYPCRQWIDLLHEWISLEQLKDLRKKVAEHTQHQELTFLFNYWLHDPDFESRRIRSLYMSRGRSDDCLRTVDAMLATDYDFSVPIKFLFEVRQRESYQPRYIPPVILTSFSENLKRIRASWSYLDRAERTSHLESMYEAIPLLNADRMDTEQKLALAKIVYESALFIHSTRGIYMAITVDPTLAKTHYDAIVGFILTDLKEENNHQTVTSAQSALQTVAASCGANELPVLLTRLAGINTFSANLALCQTHQTYLSRRPRLDLSKKSGLGRQ